MEKNDIFKAVQDLMRDPPLFLIGTGGSIPYGLPGMTNLSEHLNTTLTPKYSKVNTWNEFLDRLSKGIDLETALTDLFLSAEIQDDIVRETWHLVSEADLALLEDLILKKKSVAALSGLFSYFYRPSPQRIDIVTSNYDRVIEYACDFANLPLDNRFHGFYCKHPATAQIQKKKIVNLLKVHGSLDLFQDANCQVLSLPLRHKIPHGFQPCIITPGSEKYRIILQEPMRQILHDAMTLMDEASGYLCIGYGFNDEQIQANIVSGIRQGKPILVVTKEIGDHAAGLLANNSNRFITLTEGRHPNTTEVVINRNICEIDGTYWSADGLLSILEGT